MGGVKIQDPKGRFQKGLKRFCGRRGFNSAQIIYRFDSTWLFQKIVELCRKMWYTKVQYFWR